MKTYIVDVFAETSLQGNQLGVVLDAGELSGEKMQAIAAETNFSETTFVTARNESTACVRIFTPTAELPFAGHPTIGTAWVLAHESEHSPLNKITLQLGVGDVPVEFDSATGIGWLESPTANFESGVSAETAARLLNLNVSDIATDYPIRGAHLGPRFQIIPVTDLNALSRCRVNAELFAEYQSTAETVASLFVFTPQGHTDNANYAARMFFEANGPREDPATGSANCCFAAYLQQHREQDQPGAFHAVVDQGVEMGRASKIYLDVGSTIKVGGKVQPVFEGKLTLD